MPAKRRRAAFSGNDGSCFLADSKHRPRQCAVELRVPSPQRTRSDAGQGGFFRVASAASDQRTTASSNSPCFVSHGREAFPTRVGNFAASSEQPGTREPVVSNVEGPSYLSVRFRAQRFLLFTISRLTHVAHTDGRDASAALVLAIDYRFAPTREAVVCRVLQFLPLAGRLVFKTIRPRTAKSSRNRSYHDALHPTAASCAAFQTVFRFVET
jgi:hypothetical protein